MQLQRHKVKGIEIIQLTLKAYQKLFMMFCRICSDPYHVLNGPILPSLCCRSETRNTCTGHASSVFPANTAAAYSLFLFHGLQH